MSKNEQDPDMPPEQGGDGLLETSRRKFLAAGTASWASISLAGCSGQSGGDGDSSGTASPSNYVVTDDVVAGSDGIPEGAGGLISAGRPQRAFVPGMQAIFKIGIWDPENGDIVSDNTIDEAGVALDGRDTTVDLSFASSDREWSGNWAIPGDAETGTVGYTVEVTNGGEYTNVGVAESQLEIVQYDPQVANYVVTVDPVSINDRAPSSGDGYVQSCLPQHNFTPDMGVAFHVGIYDGASGEMVGPDSIESATLAFPDHDDIDSVDLTWDSDAGQWGYTWRGIPEGYTGTIEYEVQVQADSEAHSVGVESGSINVIEQPDTSGGPSYVGTIDTIAITDRAPDSGSGYVQSCLPQHNFTSDMAVGFHVGIYNADTGEMVGPDTIDSATIAFPDHNNIDSVDLTWDDEAGQWSYTWRGIPDGYTGTINFELQVTSGGDFNAVGVESGSINVIEKPNL